MDIEELGRLAQLVQSSNIYELTLKQGSNRITLRRQPPLPEAAEAGSELAVYTAPETDDSDETLEGELVTEREQELITVSASLVGIFYHTKPLIGLGAQVKEGQTIGFVEAMKFRDPVLAPADGRVVDVQAEDGMPVEYGQELFAIEPGAA